MATSLNDKLCIAWSGSYESLKQFQAKIYNLKELGINTEVIERFLVIKN